MVVGVPNDTVGGNMYQGSVRVFTRIGTVWSAQATLTASDGAGSDWFGSSVAISGDTIAVGVVYDDVVSSGVTNGNQGSVRVFTRSGTVWSAQATLTASDGAASDYFGASVAISGDTIAVGVSFDDVGSNTDQGSVSVFGNYRVYNQTGGIGSATLADAVNRAWNGDRLVVGNAAMSQASSVIDASQKRLTFVGVEPMTLGADALLTLGNNSVFLRSPDVPAAGLTVAGKLTAPQGGTASFEQLSVAAGGQLLQRGSTILVNQGLSTAGGGVSYLQGPVLAEGVSTAVGGQNRVAADTDVFSNYTNAGTTIVQRGILYIYGTLVNTGTMTGQVNNGFLPPAPGDGIAVGGDYTVAAGGSLTLPDPAWWLRVGGNLDIAINSPSRFDRGVATVEMTGLGTAPEQTFEVMSRNLGPVNAGFSASNYLLGSLRIRSGATVRLVDARRNAGAKGAEATYTNALFVPKGATLVTNGYKVYTRAATIAGTVSNPADIVVVPATPPCAGDVIADGVVNGVDLSAVLSSWGPCSASCIADVDGDGQVGAGDLAIVLSAWGPCPQN